MAILVQCTDTSAVFITQIINCRQISSNKPLVLKIETNACKGQNTEVKYLEHVQAVVTTNASRRGDLELFLTSPMGTRWE